MKPLTAIRKYCLYCTYEQAIEIKNCPSQNCLFFGFRFGRNKTESGKTALKAIKEFCNDCSDNKHAEVKKCTYPDCPLYALRLGKNPERAGIGRKTANSDDLRKARNYRFQLNSRHDSEVLKSERMIKTDGK